MKCVPLGQHASLIRGITFKPSDKCEPGTPGSVVCLRTSNIQEQLDESDLLAVPSSLVRSPEKDVRLGDVLVSSANSWNLVGKCCRITSLRFKSTAGGFISILRPTTDGLDPGYLYRWFSWGRTQETVRSFGRQTTNISNLDHKRTLLLPIPLPSLDEQKRLVSILDAADDLRAKRRESIYQLDSLLQSTFLEIFGDPVTNSKEWDDSVLLGDVADITSGLTKGRKLRSQSTREVPYLAVVNVQDRHLILDPLKTIEATESEIEKYRLLRNDLLLTEGGDRDKLGRGTLWQDELPECIHQNHIFRVRLHDKRWMPVFLNWLVGSDRGKRYFLSQAKQTTGIASINLSQLKRFPLLLPPLQLQERFASIVEAVESHKVSLRTQCAELESLFASLQVRAFSGELCPKPTSRQHASA